VRSFLLTLVLTTTLTIGACGGPPPAEAPRPATAGACDDGALIGKASEAGRISCDKGRACVLGEKGPKCVAEAEADLREPCGMISCGTGCSCSSAASHECLCPLLGSAAK
jgi:hypothetical protein